MQHTKIELCRNADGTPGYSSNPVKGYCPVGCSYCYSRRLYQRFRWNPEIRFVLEELATWKRAKPGDKVFVGSMMELFGPWVPDGWMDLILFNVRLYPEVTFIFLTKCPEELGKWKPWPDNCFVGATVTDWDTAYRAQPALLGVSDNVIKFLSIEPLLDNIPGSDWLVGIDWIIIGARTPYSSKTAPKIEWVREIVVAADRAGIPVFLKDNLRPIQWQYSDGRPNTWRQEFPK